jgi:hypothetical protein
MARFYHRDGPRAKTPMLPFAVRAAARPTGLRSQGHFEQSGTLLTGTVNLRCARWGSSETGIRGGTESRTTLAPIRRYTWALD